MNGYLLAARHDVESTIHMRRAERECRQHASVLESQPWTIPSMTSADTRSSRCRKDTANGCTPTSKPCRTRWTCVYSADCKRSTGRRRSLSLIWHAALDALGRGSGGVALLLSTEWTSRRKCW